MPTNPSKAPEFSQTRYEKFAKYRQEILQYPFFRDLIWSVDPEIQIILGKLRHHFPSVYKQVMGAILSNSAENKPVTYKTYLHKRVDGLADVVSAINKIQGRVSDKGYFNNIDFSTHEFDRIMNSLGESTQKTYASSVFNYEYGIKRKQVQKLVFSSNSNKVTNMVDVSKINIAVDGVAGSGKSTIAKMLAQKFGLRYVNTGAMYRSVAYISQLMSIPNGSPEAIIREFNNQDVNFVDDKVFINKVDVSKNIYSEKVTRLASEIARFPEIRAFLHEKQRSYAANKGVIMDGRDIGSVVMPHAEIKFYITATPEIRAERRLHQEKKKATSQNLSLVLEEINKRDANDLTRELNPLTKVPDAIEIDTSHLSVKDVVAQLSEIIHDKANKIN